MLARNYGRKGQPESAFELSINPISSKRTRYILVWVSNAFHQRHREREESERNSRLDGKPACGRLTEQLGGCNAASEAYCCTDELGGKWVILRWGRALK